MTIIFEIFEDLPRQGPGLDECTRRAFEMLTGLPERPEILDVGCGAGTQTIALARLSPGRITAVDVHEPMLDELRRRAAEAGYAVVGTFPLPAEGWFEFYRPLGPKLARLRKKYRHDAEALKEIAFCELEMEIYRKYHAAYGYTFFVLRKP